MTDKLVARSSLKRALPRVVAILGSLLGLSVLPGAWGIAYGQSAPVPGGVATQVPAALPATGDLASIPALIAVLGIAGTSVGFYLRRRARHPS